MPKSLSEMTLKELWQLFPIVLVGHDQRWHAWYEEEVAELNQVLPAHKIARLSHIGSTAVDTIWAKPIVDILVEVAEGCQLDEIRPLIEASGYICMSQGERRLSFNKGYTPNGFAERVFHLHLRYVGDHDELYFRDYLSDHPQVASEYERLKLGLWQTYEHDRDAYTDNKADFVHKYTQRARELYGPRYD